MGMGVEGIEFFRLFMMAIFLLIVPMMLVAMIAGLGFGIIQNMFQIQEQSLSFFPKLILMILVFVIGLTWMYEQSIIEYRELFKFVFKS